MDKLLKQIARLEESEIADALAAILRRYGEVFPDWEVSLFSVNKNEDRGEQIDQVIQVLEKMK